MGPDRQDALIDTLNKSGKRLSKSHRRIAEYIVNNHEKAAYFTAGKLAGQVGVSESTVVRFASALGYEGYPQLQKSLRELMRHRLTSVQRIQISLDIQPDQVLEHALGADMTNIRKTLAEIDREAFSRAMEAIDSAKNVYVLGLRASTILAQQLHYYLHFVLDNMRLVGGGMADVFDELMRIGEGDTLVAISFPRYSRRTVEAIHFARERGAKVVALTDGPLSPLADICDELLVARGDMISFADSLVAPMAVVNAIIVALSLRNREKLATRLDSMETVWANQSIYLEKDKV